MVSGLGRIVKKYDDVFEMFRDMYRPLILSTISDLRKTIPGMI